MPRQQKMPITLVTLRILKGTKFSGISPTDIKSFHVFTATEGMSEFMLSPKRMIRATLAAVSSRMNKTSTELRPHGPKARKAMSP